MASRSYDLVVVKWEDAHSHDGWTPLRDYAERRAIVLTVGFRLPSSKKVIVVAQSMPHQDNKAAEEVGNIWTIPKGCVISIQKIGKLTL